MFHLGAFFQSIDPAGALTAINAVAEQALTTNGVDMRVPKTMPNIIGAACLANDATATRAQIQSPSLRTMVNLDIEPIVRALVFGAPPEQSFWPNTPVALMPDESINFAILSDPAAPAGHYGLVFLADGPQSEVSGNIFSLRATAAVTLSQGVWVNGNLTFSQTLPAGRYAIVGMRALGTNLVAARLQFQEQLARPGVLAVNVIADLDPYWTRYGRMGEFGEFEHTNPPTVDCLGVTDSSQTFIFDLVKVR